MLILNLNLKYKKFKTEIIIIYASIVLLLSLLVTPNLFDYFLFIEYFIIYQAISLIQANFNCDFYPMLIINHPNY